MRTKHIICISRVFSKGPRLFDHLVLNASKGNFVVKKVESPRKTSRNRQL
jgi:hypothetical protein